MAEVSEEQKQEPVELKKSQPTPRHGSWFGVVILLIVLGLAGAGYFLFTQLRDRQEGLGGEVKGQMSKQIADYQDQLTAIQNQLASLEASIGNKDAHFNTTLANFSQLHNEKLSVTRTELIESVHRIERQLGKTRGDWLVADAEYLLTVANERLHLIGDVKTTQEALEAADLRLRESGDAGVYKVREQIANELTQLRTITVPDIIGMYVSLQSLENQVDKLVLFLPYIGKELSPSAQVHDHANKLAEGHDALETVLTQLEGIVTIRHTDQQVTEILSPEQARFIREQVRVKLEIIKMALVERNEAIFQSSLKDAVHWIEENFTKDDESRAMLNELNRFAAVKLRGNYPDISQPIKMLRDLAKLRLASDKENEPEAPSSVHNPVAVKAVVDVKSVENIKQVVPPAISAPAPQSPEVKQPEHH